MGGSGLEPAPSYLETWKVQIVIPSLANLARLDMFCNQVVLPRASSTKQRHQDIHTQTYAPIDQSGYEND